MAVYVDELVEWPQEAKPGGERHFGEGKPSCHMWADTSAELHVMAERLGLRRDWAQGGSATMLHYDLTPNKRAQAVRLGAVEHSIEAWMRGRLELRGLEIGDTREVADQLAALGEGNHVGDDR